MARIPANPLRFPDAAAWRAWLEQNGASATEAWLVISRAHVASTGLGYEAAIEEALCFGWIDGVMQRLDADAYLLRFSPRRRDSVWSVTNQRRVEKLLTEGRMTEAGLAAVRAAHESGAWEAALRREDVSTLPADLEAALAANPTAQANFAGLAPSHKRQFLHWIESARTVATRQRRIAETVAMAERNQRLGSA